ncbi:MAG: hypothetical protein NTW03_03825, partial [Verrucomicrobia bacterium]|nr:hypothetical protein [Verrucomicrobiota bacterium]
TRAIMVVVSRCAPPRQTGEFLLATNLWNPYAPPQEKPRPRIFASFAAGHHALAAKRAVFKRDYE